MTAMTRGPAFTIALLAAALLRPAAASAQETNLLTTADANPLAPLGWSFTPSLGYSGAWDDNVLIRGKGDTAPAESRSPAWTIRIGTRCFWSTARVCRTGLFCLSAKLGVQVTWPTAKRSSKAGRPLK